MHRTLVLVLTAAAALGLSASAVGSGTATVKISDYKFTPKVLHIHRGTTVTWKWTGEDPHNVTGPHFRSATKKTGTFRHRFTRRGTFKYVCTIHAKSFAMHGTIVVG